MEPDSPNPGGEIRSESGLSRSIRSLFERPSAPLVNPPPVRPAPRGRDPRDLLTTLCARYIRAGGEVRQRLAAGILEQAAVLRERGELQVVAEAAIALARIEPGPMAEEVPHLAGRLVDPEIAPLLAERLGSEPDPSVRRVLEAMLERSREDRVTRSGIPLPAP